MFDQRPLFLEERCAFRRVCRTCGGRVVLASGSTRFLHADRADWIDRPHNVELGLEPL